jgi:hypothetical protein
MPSQCESRIGQVLFRCKPEILNGFSIPPHWLRSLYGVQYLVAFVRHDHYTPVWDKDENRAEYRDISTGQFVPIVMGRYGFKLKITEPDLAFADLLREISISCMSLDLRTHTPLEVYDFVRPFQRDRLLVEGKYCSIRQGRIFEIDEGSGAIASSRGNRLYSSGFSLSFQEAKKRRYIG